MRCFEARSYSEKQTKFPLPHDLAGFLHKHFFGLSGRIFCSAVLPFHIVKRHYHLIPNGFAVGTVEFSRS
jgi:hypothetical protein